MTTCVEVKEGPILFSAPMVRALLEGRKTQTRRIIKDQPSDDWRPVVEAYNPTCIDRHGEEYPGPEVFGASDEDEGRACPYGRPGDRLWVRETFYIDLCLMDRGPLSIYPTPKLPLAKNEPQLADSLYYRADGECCDQIPECQCASEGRVPWRPSIFMPRWASRITLEITEVRVQRLQEISDEDAKAEGAPGGCLVCGDETFGDCVEHSRCYVDGFAGIWHAINGEKSWHANPWVWAISFKPLES